MKRALLYLVLFALPSAASAATLTLSASPARVGAGDEVLVTLSAQSAESVNSFSGTLMYGAGLLPVSVSDGNSVVSLWVTPPAPGSSGISFAGVVPGGFSGSGKLFSVVFRATAPGQARVMVADPGVLLNDGHGTPSAVNTQPLALSIASAPQGGYTEPSDAVPPETFTPLVAQGPDGKQYADFAATDKSSGVRYYEVAESRALFSQPFIFATATSPYLLRDQYLTSDIEVRAVDHAGNVRLEFYPHEHLLRPYEEAALVVILILAAAGTYRLLRARNTHS